jgi:DNA mismatch repair protein MutS
VENIRHPLIELINDNSEYITNTLTLNNDGILLYGLNFSGKSSLMKSIGINIILAQSGMYVAAKKFTYFPYNEIFMRIPNGDNIFMGHSTFIAEMLEVKNILHLTTSHSLVLGDEIATGTETNSGLSIVGGCILKLIEKRVSFIFATHMHELLNLKDIKKHIENKILKIKHMSISYDENMNIKYDRQLKDGNGSKQYGLEVANSLGFDISYITSCNKIRNEITNQSETIVNTKNSSYNRKVYFDVCAECKLPSQEIHHIKFQKDADENGFLKEGFHKNRTFNLIPLCKSCHLIMHHTAI